MKVIITLNVVDKIDTQEEMKKLVECWIHDQANTRLEVFDPSTGNELGELFISWAERGDVDIRVEG